MPAEQQLLPVGTRVRLSNPVDRYPHFIAEAGSLGTVASSDADVLAVELDEPLAGAEDWDNQVLWSLRDGDQPSWDLEVLA
jgi:hypothetical protein